MALSTLRKRRLAATVLLLENDVESSDSDTENFALAYLMSHKRKKSRHRQIGYIPRVVSQFRPDEFKLFFRVSRTSVQTLKEYICEVCMDENVSGILCRQSTGGSAQKPLEDRILMMLWYMASADKYSAIADRFGTSESTASYAIRNLLEFVQDYLMRKVIILPDDDEQQEIQDMYEELKNFPGVKGMIDGTHIQIRKPSDKGIDNYNRKSYYSVLLQGVVREDMRFIDVFAGYPGKVHDARVLRQSPLFEKGHTLCGRGHILGDSAYPNLPWLLTPFRDNGHLTNAQTCFNRVHSGIRCKVEHAFGLLKRRFVRLQHIDQRDIQTIVQTIITGCVLHNICILNEDTFKQVLHEDDVQRDNVNIDQFDGLEQEQGARKRLQIAHRLSK